MPNKFSDRVKETSTTTGTGSLILDGTASQFQSFSSQFSSGDPFYYAIIGQTGTEWEVGLGTLLASNSLGRTIVLQSSSSNQLISLSAGTKDVFNTLASLQANRETTLGVSLASYLGMNLP